MIKNITIFFVTAMFILFFLPVCFSQSAVNASAGSNASATEAGINKDENAGGAGAGPVQEGTEVKTEEKTAEEKTAEAIKAEKKKEEEKKQAEEEKKKEAAKEEEPPAPEESLDNWGEYAPAESQSRSDEPSYDVWNDNQGFIDR
ncbi:MAG: hypothetical protein PHT53_02090 [Candidatus Omnitrophica bacterium]|nr:hypothetical protein [Candidatus Omnitrophota bacterium]